MVLRSFALPPHGGLDTEGTQIGLGFALLMCCHVHVQVAVLVYYSDGSVTDELSEFLNTTSLVRRVSDGMTLLMELWRLTRWLIKRTN